MSFSWSDQHPEEYGEEEQEQTQQIASGVAEAVQAMEQQELQDADIDERLSEVEKRLEVATYYRLLLSQQLFDQETEAAQTVEKEVRGFIRSRLEIFMGMKQEKSEPAPVKLPFSPDQLKALLSLADSILAKPSLAKQINKADSKPEPKAEPSLRKVEVPKPVAPQVRTVSAPVATEKPKVKPGPKPKAAKQALPAKELAVNPITGEEYMKDVTPVTRPPPGTPGYVPTPTNLRAMEMESAMAAQRQASALQGVSGSSVESSAMQDLIARTIQGR